MEALGLNSRGQEPKEQTAWSKEQAGEASHFQVLPVQPELKGTIQAVVSQKQRLPSVMVELIRHGTSYTTKPCMWSIPVPLMTDSSAPERVLVCTAGVTRFNCHIKGSG